MAAAYVTQYASHANVAASAVNMTQMTCNGMVVPPTGFSSSSTGFVLDNNNTLTLQMDHRVTAVSVGALNDSDTAEIVSIMAPQLSAVSVVNREKTPPVAFAVIMPPPSADAPTGTLGIESGVLLAFQC